MFNADLSLAEKQIFTLFLMIYSQNLNNWGRFTAFG